MKPAQTTRSGSCSAIRAASARSQASRVGVIGEPLHEDRYPGALGPGQPLDTGAVGAYRHDPGAVGFVRHSVQQGL